jgi:hypothetical protein
MEDDNVKLFIDNFHKFFGPQYLKELNEVLKTGTGSSFHISSEKRILSDKEFAVLYEEHLYSILKDAVEKCSPYKKGGGLSLAKLKNDVRNRISLIEPRKSP